MDYDYSAHQPREASSLRKYAAGVGDTLVGDMSELQYEELQCRTLFLDVCRSDILYSSKKKVTPEAAVHRKEYDFVHISGSQQNQLLDHSMERRVVRTCISASCEIHKAHTA